MKNISWINNNIAVGPAMNNEEIKELKKIGVIAIIDLRSEYCDDETFIGGLGLEFLHVEIDDRYPPASEQLNEILDFVNPFLDKNKKIFIHCQNGCGRSPLVAIAILIKRGMDTSGAVSLIEERNPITGFTVQQERFIYSLKPSL